MMEIPALHSNGTSKARLLEDVCNAADKVRDAIEALAQAAPSGRDYYVKDSGAWDRAISQHSDRMLKLRAVLLELEELAEGIDVQ